MGEVKAAIQVLDQDRDGKISIRELEAWMKAPHKNRVRKPQKLVESEKTETRGGSGAYRAYLLRKRQEEQAEVVRVMSNSTGRATPMRSPHRGQPLSSKGCQADFTESESDDLRSPSPDKQVPSGKKEPRKRFMLG